MLTSPFKILVTLLALAIALLSQSVSAYATPLTHSVRLGYQISGYSFTDSSHGFELTTSLEKKKRWAVRAGARYTHKFGFDDPGALLGVSYWFNDFWFADVDVEFAPGQIIFAHQAYQARINFTGIRRLEAALRYRYADYSEANLHQIGLQALVYFSDFWFLDARVGLNQVETAAGQNDTNFAASLRLIHRFNDKFDVYAGYAFGQESFDSGNPASPLGRFNSHHGFTGVIWQLPKSFQVDLSLDYEYRSNTQSVVSSELGLGYHW